MTSIVEVDTAINNTIYHIVLTQLEMKAGIRTYDEAGVRLIFKEMKQFHDREVVKSLMPSEETHAIKKRQLAT